MKNYIKIQPKVQEYDWGNKTFIPSLLDIEADNKPKAELWMGTHSGAPATLEDGSLFSSFLDSNPEFLGQKHLDKYGTYLPLLFKVLAIEKPLSIQCHPTVEIAKKGWKDEEKFRLDNPKSLWNYKDNNRKAEVIYALSPLTAMCGFTPYKVAISNLKQVIPEGYKKYLSAVEGNAEISENEKLKFIFDTLYRMDRSRLKSLIKELMSNVEEPETKDKNFLSKEEIIIRSYEEYPEDPGLFCPLILNVAHLQVGESLFLEPCILHAYVLGNGIELMSASDNVLRGGLTHKKMDVDELIRVMIVKGGNLELAKKHKDDFNRVIVETPTEEFTLAVMENSTFTVTTDSIEILLNTSSDTKLIVEGENINFKKGEVIVIACGKSYTLTTTNSVYCAKID
jgi:mannose-6-phosphate isomerase